MQTKSTLFSRYLSVTILCGVIFGVSLSTFIYSDRVNEKITAFQASAHRLNKLINEFPNEIKIGMLMV